MNCDYCEERIGCQLRKELDDGTALFSCGLDVWKGVVESAEKRFNAMISEVDKEMMERFELLDPIGPELPRALPIELKGIAV